MKSRKVLLLFAVVLILCSSFVYAEAEITDLGMFIGDDEIQFINYRRLQVGSLNFHVNTIDTITSLTGTITELNPNPNLLSAYTDIDFFNDYCLENFLEEMDDDNNTVSIFQGYFCKMPLVQILMNDLTAQLNFTIDDELIQQNLTFRLDDSSPEVREIKTGYCEDEICFISNGGFNVLQLDFSDRVGTFIQNKVFYKLGSESTKRFTNCTSNSCLNKYYTSNCRDGDSIIMKLVSSGGIPSSDDAGNPFSNTGSRTIVCDEYDPIIESVSHTFMVGGSAPSNTPLKQGDVITFTINVSEAITDVSALGFFEELNGNNNSVEGSCSQSETGATCTWLVTAENNGDFFVNFNASDGVGHVSLNEEYRIHVDYFEHNESIETPVYFNDVITTSMAAKGYNRISIGLMMENGLDIPLYQTFTLEKIGSDEVEIVAYADIESSYCYMDWLNGTTSEASAFKLVFADPYLDWNEENRLDLEFRFSNLNMYPDKFSLVCNVSAYVRTNEDTYYDKPTIFEMTVPVQFRNSALGDLAPGEKLAKKIIKKEKDMKGFLEYIDVADAIMSSLTDICNVYSIWTDVNAMFTTVEITGVTVAPVDGGTTQIAGDIGRKSVATPINSLANVGGFVKKACSWVNCNVKEQFDANSDSDEKENNWWTSSSDWWTSDKDWGLSGYVGKDSLPITQDLFANINRPNVKESLISSVMLQCYPGILYHINKYRQVECHELLCYKQNARYGLSLDVCEQAKGKYICQSVVGELFELPYIRQIKNLASNANALVQGLIPSGIKYLITNPLCKNVVGPESLFGTGDAGVGGKIMEWPIIIGCHLPEAIGRITETKYRLSSTTQSFMYPSQDDVCSLALCNEDDLDKCEDNKPSWITGLRDLELFDVVNIDYKVTIQKPTFGELRTLMNDAQGAGGEAARTKLIDYGFDSTSLGEDSTVATRSVYLNTKLDEMDQYMEDTKTKSTDQVSTGSDGKLHYSFLSLTSYDTQNTVLDDYAKEYPKNGDETYYGSEDVALMINSNNGEIIPEYAYDELSAEEQDLIKQYNKDTQAYKIAETARQNSINSYEAELTQRITDLESVDSDAAREELNELKDLQRDFETLELCRTAEDCNSDAEKSIQNTINNKLGDQVKQEQIQFRKQQTINKVFQVTDELLKVAYKMGYLNWAELSAFGHETVAGQVADFMNSYVNPDNIKDSICSLTNDLGFAEGENLQGSAVQCMEGTCRPVLTFASEKLKINETDYLYTLTYYLGNVRRPAGIPADENIQYNVFLKKPGVQTKWFKANWLDLPYGEFNNAEYGVSRLIGDGNYNQICIKFKYNFPPLEAQSDTEYCRDIKDASIGMGDYDTGSFNPTLVEGAETTTGDSSTDPYELNDI